jgi:hypothetical protein
MSKSPGPERRIAGKGMAATLSHTVRRCSASPTPGQLEIRSEEVVGEKKGHGPRFIDPDRVPGLQRRLDLAP